MVRYPAKGGRAMTVGRNPYRAPDDAPPMPGPASGVPPSRFPGPRSRTVGVCRNPSPFHCRPAGVITGPSGVTLPANHRGLAAAFGSGGLSCEIRHCRRDGLRCS